MIVDKVEKYLLTAIIITGIMLAIGVSIELLFY